MATSTRNNSIVYIDDTTALVTKAFAKRANIFGTPEFKLWREYLAEFPQAKMHTKSVKRTAQSIDTRNMTYKNMAAYIRTLDNSAKLMAEFELVCKRSKVQTNPYRSVLAWFELNLAGYDSYKSFFSDIADERAEKNNIFHLDAYKTEKPDTTEATKRVVNG